MHRFRIPLIAVAFLVVLAAAMPTPGGAQETTPTATPPAQPQQPTTGPGSSEALFGSVSTIEQGAPDQPQPDSWLFVPADPLPGAPAAEEPLPLVIFLPGSGATDTEAYLAWIEHLVRRGAVVLYPLYQRAGIGEAVYRQTLQDDVRNSLSTLEREGVAVDPARMAVVGHSLGAGLAVDYAASAAAAGLPVPTAVMSVAPSCSAAAGACMGVDLGAIPATTRILLVTGADDADPTVADGVTRIWAELGGVPLDNRDVVTLVSDARGKPRLHADHGQALAAQGGSLVISGYGPNAHDWYGTWKWLDALMGCAFAGEWCEVALGNTPEQRFMGVWSDGVPVTEAVVTDDPA